MKRFFHLIICMLITVFILSGCDNDKSAYIDKAMEDMDSFTQGLIAEVPTNLTQFYEYNNLEEIRDSFWFSLTQANILYDGNTLFAVVDTTLHPEYAVSGSAKLDYYINYYREKALKDVEVLRNDAVNYSLVYEPDQKPADAVIDTFMAMDANSQAQNVNGEGVLLDFYYGYGADYWTEYELMSLDMVEGEDSNAALLYIRDGSFLRKGYPIEINESELYDLRQLIEQYNLKSWEGIYRSEEMVVDASGYQMAAKYDNEYIYSDGYFAYPDGYDEEHEAIVDFFETLEDEIQLQELIENVTGIWSLDFGYGDHLKPEETHQYAIVNEEDKITISYGNGDEWFIKDVPIDKDAMGGIFEIYQKHNVFEWIGYEEIVEGQTEFVFMSDILIDAEGKSFNFSVYGIGKKPEGWQAFCDELTIYLDGLVGNTR